MSHRASPGVGRPSGLDGHGDAGMGVGRCVRRVRCGIPWNRSGARVSTEARGSEAGAGRAVFPLPVERPVMSWLMRGGCSLYITFMRTPLRSPLYSTFMRTLQPKRTQRGA